MNDIFKKFRNSFSKKPIQLVVLLLIALISIFVISNIVTKPSFNAATFKSLDNKKITVLQLAGASAATSTTLSLIPGDGALPIANQLAELSKYFLIILSAIILEKMLLSVAGSVVFTYLVPFACFLWGLYLFTRKDTLRNLSIKLVIFSIVLFGAIPASIQISDLMYSAYNSQIEQAVKSAEENKTFITDKKNELSNQDSSWMDKVGNFISGLTASIEHGVSEMIEKGENTLNKFLDTVAVLLVTTCVIPIAVLLIFAFTIKILFGITLINKDNFHKINKSLKSKQIETGETNLIEM